MSSSIPSHEDDRGVSISLDGVSFRLREQQHDLEWIRPLGVVFKVFDQQDSGNICFGVEKNGVRSFVKYAGARPMSYKGEPQDAVARLAEAMPLYSDLQHRHLIRLQDHFPTGDGYAAVFEWFEGECLHPHWLFSGPDKYSHPDSPFYRFKQLPVEQRLKSLDAILSFHVLVEEKGYVAVDFYDGSILYDFARHSMRICDIDFYRRSPSVNDMGNFWGSKRFKSPEEYELGAIIDSRTNVFNLGAIAFSLLGGELDRDFSQWEAGKPLYEVALQAVREDRESRFNSIRDLHSAWNAAKNKE